MCTIIPRGNGVCFLFDLFVLSRTVTTLHDIGGHDGKPVVPLFVGKKTCVCKIPQSPGTPAKPVHIGRGVHQRQELVFQAIRRCSEHPKFKRLVGIGNSPHDSRYASGKSNSDFLSSWLSAN